MRFLLLLGSKTPLDILFLDLFFRENPPGQWVVGIERNNAFKLGKLKRYARIIKDSGSRFLFFNSLLQVPFGLHVGFNRKAGLKTAEKLSAEVGFETFRFSRINSGETVGRIEDYKPSLILNHMPQIIRSKALFKSPHWKLINIHPGLLPSYQGLGSCLWPLIQNEQFHGATLHIIDSEAIDAGPIVACGRMPISPQASVFSLHVMSRIIAAKLAARLVNRVYGHEELMPRIQIGGRYHNTLPDRKRLTDLTRKHPYFVWHDRKILNGYTDKLMESADDTTGWMWTNRSSV